MDVRQISDIVEIQTLLADYVYAIDAKDFDALDAVFTPDAHIDYTQAGGESGSYQKIKPYLSKALADFPVTQHLIGMPQIRLNGDRATATTMLFNPMLLRREGGDEIFFVGLNYRDELVRTAEGWRISKRVEADVWMKDFPKDFTPVKA